MDLILNPREPVNTWTHLAGLVLAIAGAVFLWRRSEDAGAGPWRRVGLVIYGASLIFCYTTSSFFHGVRVPPEKFALFEKLDRIGIFVLIAGSYTPLAGTLLKGWWRWGTLAVVWGITAIATVRLLSYGPFPIVLNSLMYLGMGWGAVACFPALTRAVPRRDLDPLISGGVLYSVGAVINLIGWPVFWPGVFGGHELFHLFVIAGSLAHYRLMMDVVLPYQPSTS